MIANPESRLADVLRAFETSGGSVRQTTVALNEAGIPSPRGKRWGDSTLRRVLEANRADLPDPSPRGVRRAVGTKAVLTGLLRCHCGRRMTPNAARGQYYCAGGRDTGHHLHGHYSVTEAALLVVLRPEADRYSRRFLMATRSAQAELDRAERSVERRKLALDTRIDVGRITPEAHRAGIADLDAQLAELRRAVRAEKTVSLEHVPAWPGPGEDVVPMNTHLRRIWTYVQLDPAMTVGHVLWRVQPAPLDENVEGNPIPDCETERVVGGWVRRPQAPDSREPAPHTKTEGPSGHAD